MIAALHNCLTDISMGEYRLAANEVDLIHDLPLYEEDIAKWDQWSFYLIQLARYLDNVEDASRVKQLVKMLADVQNKYTQS